MDARAARVLDVSLYLLLEGGEMLPFAQEALSVAFLSIHDTEIASNFKSHPLASSTHSELEALQFHNQQSLSIRRGQVAVAVSKEKNIQEHSRL